MFLNTIAGVLGEYHATAAMDTFTDGGGRHLAFLAMLAGARMVTAAETEEGRPWAETRIKEMTGGTPVTANFMRQNPFTFTPEFKITITGNHKPVLRNVDDAARRRFNMVPFLHKPAEPDRQLEERLRKEWPGILRWMIDGCLAWQTDGLPKPKVVAEATDEYFAAHDALAQWMAERCIVAPTLGTRRYPEQQQEWMNAELFRLADPSRALAGRRPGRPRELRRDASATCRGAGGGARRACRGPAAGAGRRAGDAGRIPAPVAAAAEPAAGRAEAAGRAGRGAPY